MRLLSCCLSVVTILHTKTLSNTQSWRRASSEPQLAAICPFCLDLGDRSWPICLMKPRISIIVERKSQDDSRPYSISTRVLGKVKAHNYLFSLQFSLFHLSKKTREYNKKTFGKSTISTNGTTISNMAFYINLFSAFFRSGYYNICVKFSYFSNQFLFNLSLYLICSQKSQPTQEKNNEQKIRIK